MKSSARGTRTLVREQRQRPTRVRVPAAVPRDVAAEADGAAALAAALRAPRRVVAERVVHAREPPRPEAQADVGAVELAAAEQRVGEAEAHRAVVRVLPRLEAEPVARVRVRGAAREEGGEVEARLAAPRLGGDGEEPSHMGLELLVSDWQRAHHGR